MLAFYIVKCIFSMKIVFYYVKIKCWAQVLRDEGLISNFASLIFNTNDQVWEASTKANHKLVQNRTL